jgi:DNA-binding CsgD family transcriptional regulator
MLQYLIYLVFILSVAMAAGAITIASGLRKKFTHGIFSTLLYYVAFIFAFGFYGIWGQAVIKAFLASYISPELLERFSDIAILLGLPFIVFAWMMLIRLAVEISGRKNNNWFVTAFLFLNFSFIVIVGYLVAKTNTVLPVSLIRTFFISMNIIYTLTASGLILFPLKRKALIHDLNRKVVASSIMFITLLQCTLLYFYTSQILIAVAFILAFFAGNTFLPVYLNYGTILTSFLAEPAKDLSLEEFCKKYEVSPRETDIVREICNGLSNKEISGKLFISLQTVKDHTHRIYSKTNVRSRAQLMNLVKELKIS